MPTFFYRLVTYIVLVSFVGCTSMRAVIPEDNDPNIPQKPMNQLMSNNEWIYIIKRDGSRTALKLTSVTDIYLEGVVDTLSAPIRVDCIDIVRIERRTFDGGKTTLFLLGTLIVSFVAVGMVAGAVVGATQVSF